MKLYESQVHLNPREFPSLQDSVVSINPGDVVELPATAFVKGLVAGDRLRPLDDEPDSDDSE